MAENSGIAWTHHTVNPWWGCSKVSPACANCYAEGVDHRFAKGGEVHWGANAPRRLRVIAAEHEAMRYEKRAVKGGRRFRVFCASMADFFEDRRDLDESRLRFLDVIRRTPHLDWLILTKRPEKIREHLERAYRAAEEERLASPLAVWLWNWLDGMLVPENVALGTTVESQDFAHRVVALLKVPARTHFVSVEPMLGPVDLYLPQGCGDCDPCIGGHPESCAVGSIPVFPGLDWVICGGESGHHARSMGAHLAQALRVQCRDAGVAFFMKQLSQADRPNTYDEFDTFPPALQVRQFPAAFDYL